MEMNFEKNFYLSYKRTLANIVQDLKAVVYDPNVNTSEIYEELDRRQSEVFEESIKFLNFVMRQKNDPAFLSFDMDKHYLLYQETVNELWRTVDSIPKIRDGLT